VLWRVLCCWQQQQNSNWQHANALRLVTQARGQEATNPIAHGCSLFDEVFFLVVKVTGEQQQQANKIVLDKDASSDGEVSQAVVVIVC